MSVNIRKTSWLIVLCIVVPIFAFAQDAVTSRGPAVQIVVTPEVKHGANMPKIERDEVFVYEGKDRDQVTQWIPATGEHAALELYVLIDDGSGISTGAQLDSLRQYIQGLPSTMSVGIAYMQNGAAKIAQQPTTDRTAATKALRLPLGIPGISASPYMSLSDLLKHWPENKTRRAVLMITDGIDQVFDGESMDNPYVDQAVSQAQHAGVLVYAIYSPGIGHYDHTYWRTTWGQMYLSEVSDQTGGESYYIGFTGAPVTFVPYLEDMSNRFGRQYLLTFIAKPQKKAGMQRIKLSTEVPNVELVGPESVYVPASE
jgi:hypothetical protein